MQSGIQGLKQIRGHLLRVRHRFELKNGQGIIFLNTVER